MKMTELIKQLDRNAIGPDKSLGRIRWLQGQALNSAKLQCRHGEWRDLIDRLGLSQSTAYLLRVIADKVDTKQSHTLSYDEMRAIAFLSYKKAKRPARNGKRSLL